MERLLRNIYGAVFVLPKGAALSDAISCIQDLLDVEGRKLHMHIGSRSGNLPQTYIGANTDHLYIHRSNIHPRLLDLNRLQQDNNRVFVIYQHGDDDEHMIDLDSDLGGYILITYLDISCRSTVWCNMPDKYYEIYADVAVPIRIPSLTT